MIQHRYGRALRKFPRGKEASHLHVKRLYGLCARVHTGKLSIGRRFAEPDCAKGRGSGAGLRSDGGGELLAVCGVQRARTVLTGGDPYLVHA